MVVDREDRRLEPQPLARAVAATNTDHVAEAGVTTRAFDDRQHRREVVGVQVFGDVSASALVGVVAQDGEPGAGAGHDLAPGVDEHQELRRVVEERGLYTCEAVGIVGVDRTAGVGGPRGPSPTRRIGLVIHGAFCIGTLGHGLQSRLRDIRPSPYPRLRAYMSASARASTSDATSRGPPVA